MKKIVFLLLLIPSFLFGQNEKLLMDKVSADGTRTICTFYHYINTGAMDTAPIGIAFLSTIRDGIRNYFLSIKMRNVSFTEDGALLVKTSTDEILEFRQLYNEYESESTHYIPYQGIIEMGTALYNSSIEDLEKLINEGIKKVRVETSVGLVDREYKPKRVEKHKKELEAMFQMIKSESLKQKDIYTDF